MKQNMTGNGRFMIFRSDCYERSRKKVSVLKMSKFFLSTLASNVKIMENIVDKLTTYLMAKVQTVDHEKGGSFNYDKEKLRFSPHTEPSVASSETA